MLLSILAAAYVILGALIGAAFLHAAADEHRGGMALWLVVVFRVVVLAVLWPATLVLVALASPTPSGLRVWIETGRFDGGHR